MENLPFDYIEDEKFFLPDYYSDEEKEEILNNLLSQKEIEILQEVKEMEKTFDFEDIKYYKISIVEELPSVKSSFILTFVLLKKDGEYYIGYDPDGEQYIQGYREFIIETLLDYSIKTKWFNIKSLSKGKKSVYEKCLKYIMEQAPAYRVIYEEHYHFEQFFQQ